MKKVFSNITLIFGVFAFVAFISYLVIVEPWTNKCFQYESIFVRMYLGYFVNIFLTITPYLSIFFYLFSIKDKKANIGLILNVVVILIFLFMNMFKFPYCSPY